MSGVCTCGGQLEKKSIRQAWASIDKFSANPPNEDCYQCEKCLSIYDVTFVTAKAHSIHSEDSNVEDFGVANGSR